METSGNFTLGDVKLISCCTVDIFGMQSLLQTTQLLSFFFFPICFAERLFLNLLEFCILLIYNYIAAFPYLFIPMFTT